MRLFNKVNGLGIGPQGLGGTCAVLDVKVTSAPTHIAGLPIAVNVQCNKAHHLSAEMDGSGAITEFPVPARLPYFENLIHGIASPRRVTLPMDENILHSLKAGEPLLLTGRLLTARDAAHKRLHQALERGEPLPVDLNKQILYYVGPVAPIEGEIIGAAGPTTASRMDLYTPQLLAKTGLQGAIGKSERGPAALAAFRNTHTVYFIAIGGAGFLQSKTIKSVRTLAYEDLGTEAIRELEVQDFPVIVAVDSAGGNIHALGRQHFAEWIRQNNWSFG